MPAFKFTLHQWDRYSQRRLVYGTNCYSRMVVGVIYRSRQMTNGYKYSAIRYWADPGLKSFKSLGEARQWLEDGFRAQVIGSLAREDSA